MALKLTSPAFKHSGDIPPVYTCDGSDLSPALAWSNLPEGTQSLALIVDDPDAPGGTFSHWVVYNLPPRTTHLDEAVKKGTAIPGGGSQGRNDFGKIGYGGPCPPRGSTHRYFFDLFALNINLNLPAAATRAQVEDAMDTHVLARGKLVARYNR